MNFEQLDYELCEILFGINHFESQYYGAGFIDFNVSTHPTDTNDMRVFESQIDILQALHNMRAKIREMIERSSDLEESKLLENLIRRLTSHETYLRKKNGEQFSFKEYIQNTIHITPASFSDEYLNLRKNQMAEMLRELDCNVTKNWYEELDKLEEAIPTDLIAEEMRSQQQRAMDYIKRIVPDIPAFELKIELVEDKEYWNYWVDGEHDSFRLRLNRHRNLTYTKSSAMQFVFHELVGHCAQMANWHSLIQNGKLLNYFGLTTVHSPEQFVFEGSAQTLPLFFPDLLNQNPILKARVYLDHLRHTVFGNAQILINQGTTLKDCVDYVQSYLPFWETRETVDNLRSRSQNPLFTTYLYSYPTGYDYFLKLAETKMEEENIKLLGQIYNGYLSAHDLNAHDSR